MPAAIFNGDKIRILKSILSINNGADIHSGTVDPSSSAVNALRGSLYLNTSNGTVYRKTDDGSSTNWVNISAVSGAATTALDNLASVAINADLVAGTTNTIDLGTTSNEFKDIYARTIKSITASKLGIDFVNGTLSLDGSQVILLGSTASFSLTVRPDATTTYDLGTDTRAWRDLFIQNIKTAANVAAIDITNNRLVTGATTKLDWSGTDVDLNTRKLTSVVDPSSAQDAATKNYVDGLVGGRLITRTVYGTSGSPHTWTKATNNPRYVKVLVVGGGGSGGGVSASGASEAAEGGAGAGGGYSEKIIQNASLGATETVTVGAGGAAASSAGNGNSGGASSFGSHCSATGGGGGDSGAATSGNIYESGGTAGVGAGGDINLEGGRGGPGQVVGGVAQVRNYSGSSYFSETTYTSSANANGIKPVGYGGGSTGARSANGAARVSTAGGDGVVIVEEYN